MHKILVIYYSRTGNTEKMAESVAEGIKRERVGCELERLALSRGGACQSVLYHLPPEGVEKVTSLCVEVGGKHHEDRESPNGMHAVRRLLDPLHGIDRCPGTCLSIG